jgi:hypothetical protein
MRIFGMTTGPILELGSGMYSTCYLHWACHPRSRPLVTYEGQAEWMSFAAQFRTDWHKVELVTDWPSLDLSTPWSLALVDHDGPGVVRGNELRRLMHADYVVCHDAERAAQYGYADVFPLFKHCYVLRNSRIRTMILSNSHDLLGFAV